MKFLLAVSMLSSALAFTQFLGGKAKKMQNVQQVEDNRPRFDPFGLYPKDAPERKAGLINPLESTPKPQGPVKDPLNIYQSKDEVDSTTEMSASLPFLQRPELLDGTLPGDRGFDPLGFANSEAALQWQRTAEIKHARIAMLAAVGWPLSELFDKKLAALWGLSPLLNSGDRVPSVLNGGLSQTSLAFWAATLGVAAGIESLSLLKESNAKLAGKPYTPGDLGFDPFSFKALTKEGRVYEAEGELFNGRLAMLAITGFALQEFVTGTGVINETPFFFTNPF